MKSSSWSSLSVLLRLLYFVIAAYGEPEILDNDCQRTCEWPPAPRTCEYEFKVEWLYAMGAACSIGCADSDLPNEHNVECQQHPDCIILDGVSRPVNVVNGQFPGPSIQVCEGDTIVVEVFNELGMTEEGTTIHWHGMKQMGTPYMDGVPMITQCPIEHHQRFQYEFKADSIGTHWWHSHSGVQRGDGVYGSLVVRQPTQSDPHSDLYDYDLPEHVFIVSDWYHKMSFQVLTETELAFDTFDPDAILINDKGRRVDGMYNDFSDYEIFAVEKGFRYRFRVIDSGINSCRFAFSIDGHVLTVIATDGQAVEPYDVTSISLGGADRYDFIVHADQEIDNFWLKVQADDCLEGLEASAILHYKGAQNETPSYDIIDYPIPEVVLNDCYYSNSENRVGITNLNSLGIQATPTQVHSTLYIPVEDIEDRYVFRRRVFWKPSSPLLYQSRDIEAHRFCDGNSTNCDETLCYCIDTINVKLGEIIELVFLNVGEDWRCHPIHLHGHTFHIVAQQALEHPITMEEFKEQDRQGLIQRKLQSAPIKDSAHMPEHGYLIIRVVADNPGWWFLHCHSEWHLALGMAMVFKVGEDDEIPPPPANFPRCGSWSPADSGDTIFGAQSHQGVASGNSDGAQSPLGVSSDMSDNSGGAHSHSGVSSTNSVGAQSHLGVASVNSDGSQSQSGVSSANSGDGSSASARRIGSDLNHLDVSLSQPSNWTSLTITLGVLLVITGSATLLLSVYVLNIKRCKKESGLERTLLLHERQIKI